MRIQVKLALLVFLVLTGTISAVIWKTRALLIQDKLGFIADSSMKQVAPLKRLAQERLDDQKSRLVKFAAGRASAGAGRLKLPGDYDAVALVQIAHSQWTTNWIEKQGTTKADLPAGFEQTLLKSLPYAKVRDGETYWARLSDRQGVPLYALLVSVEVQGAAATGEAGTAALPESVDYTAAPTGTGKKAVVVGLTAGAPLADLTEDYIGSTNNVYIVDDKGYIASHVNKAYLGALFSQDPIVAEIINTKKTAASGNYQDIESRDVLGHFERIDRTNLYAVISTPLAPTRESVSNHVRTALAAASAVGLLGLLITWLLGRGLAAQVEAAVAASSIPKNPPLSIASLKPMKPAVNPEVAPVVVSAVAKPGAPALQPAQPATPAAPSQVTVGFINAVKEPVLAILGHAQLALAKANDPQVAGHADSIGREARRLKETLDRLQSWSESPSTTRKVEALDVKAIVEAVLDENAEELKADGIFVARELHEIPKVRGTAEELRVAVANILANSREALRARTKKHIRVTLELNDQGAKLAFNDSGVGMSRDVRERAFEPFYKSFESPDRIGLGLAVVQRTLKVMGGNCVIESSPGEGATVTLQLPVTDEDRQFFNTAPLAGFTEAATEPAATAVAIQLPETPTEEERRAVPRPPPLTREPAAGASAAHEDDDLDEEDEKFANVSLSAKSPFPQATNMKSVAESESETLLEPPPAPAAKESGPEEFKVRVRRPRVRS